jgi:hypothetical protein
LLKRFAILFIAVLLATATVGAASGASIDDECSNAIDAGANTSAAFYCAAAGDRDFHDASVDATKTQREGDLALGADLYYDAGHAWLNISHGKPGVARNRARQYLLKAKYTFLTLSPKSGDRINDGLRRTGLSLIEADLKKIGY